MSWERKVQKKPTWGSETQAPRESLFKTRGFSKPVEQPLEKTALKPIQFRGTDTSHLDHLKVNNTNRPIVTPRVDLSSLQAKLTVGAPGDKYEQEADAMASRVMSVPDAAVQREMVGEETDEVQTKPLAAAITPLVQREAMPEEEVQAKSLNASIQREVLPEEEVQAKPLDASIQRETLPEEEEVQTKPSLQLKSNDSFQAGGNIESQLNNSKGGGSPLGDDVRGFMEPRFGADFSNVRVHTGGDAVQMNRELGAQAFAHGSDIYFGAGKAPGNNELTAHELTHVVQQTGGVQTKLFPTVQRKCSACEEEQTEVQRSPLEISAVSASGIQRWSLFGDDEDKTESENTSSGDVLDWAKEKAGAAVDTVTQAGGDAYDWAKEKGSAAVDSVTQAGGDAYDWAKEKGSAAIDSVTQAGSDAYDWAAQQVNTVVDLATEGGGQALDLISNWRSIQVDWNSEPAMILIYWASKLDPEIVLDISARSPADLYNLIDVPDQIQQAAKELAKKVKMDVTPGFAPSPNFPVPDIDIPGIPDRKPAPNPVPDPQTEPSPAPDSPSSPSPLLFLLLLVGIIIFLAILYYGGKKKVKAPPGSGYKGGGGTSGGGGSSDSWDDEKTPENKNEGGCSEKKFDSEYLTAKDLINESEGFQNPRGSGTGHMKKEHVGKLDKELCQRACDSTKRKATTASTFKDLAEADTSIQNILNNKKGSIKQWAINAAIGDEGNFSVQQTNIGTTATCKDANTKSCDYSPGKGVKIFLIFDPSWKVGKGCFWMLTGHPTK
jgi:hypothetical protein